MSVLTNVWQCIEIRVWSKRDGMQARVWLSHPLARFEERGDDRNTSSLIEIQVKRYSRLTSYSSQRERVRVHNSSAVLCQG